jgi:HK97 family phage major capsid protein
VPQASFLSDSTTIGQLEQLAHSSLPIGSVNLGMGMAAEELVQRIESGNWGAPLKMAAAGDVTIGDGSSPARRGAYGGMVRQLRRPLRLLDLIPSAPGDGSGFDYTQETGSFDTAVETVEGAVKPAGEITFTDAEVRFRTIPHWVKIPRQQLADVPGLQTVIENRLIYGVLRRVENQIVSGDGTGENLRGILSTTGIASVAFDADVPLGELPLSGIVDVLMADAEPNGVVLNPTDWATMVTAKAEGSGEYVGNGPFGTGARTLWDLPSIPSKAIAAGTALVGDWSQCTLFVREGANVRASDSDQDDFVRNRVTLLGEGRFGLAVWQPAAFAEVALAGA